jgi:serine/threonine protein phosphatase 1
MWQFLNSLLRRSDHAGLPAVPDGERVYAMGDIHGRLDLFEALVGAIEWDDKVGVPARTTVILLGDLVDRGADSAGVVRRTREWQQERDVRILCGNHEEMFLKSFTDTNILPHFLRHGGKQTLASYGADMTLFVDPRLEEVQAAMVQLVPGEDRAFMESFEDMVCIGDYAFVHAGVDPAAGLEDQIREHLRWIREPFLSHAGPCEKVVVHGHSIAEEPQDMGNRIGIDTGAYMSGRLTALVLEGSGRRYIETCVEDDGAIAVRHRAGN